MFATPARLGRRQASSPRSGPSRSRTPSWMRLSARNPSTAPTVPSRSNRSKTRPDHAAHLLVRIQHHLPGGTAHQPGRQRHRQLAAAGLGDPPGPHPLPDQVQLSLADRALEAQQQPVVMLGRVIDAVQVAQQRPGQRAQLQQLMPLPARPGQPGHLDAQHDAHMIQPHLRRPAAQSPGARRPRRPNAPGPHRSPAPATAPSPA